MKFILGTKEAIMWLLGTLLLWHHAAPWYNITKAVLGIPIAMLGGKLYAWHKSKTQKKKLKRLIRKSEKINDLPENQIAPPFPRCDLSFPSNPSAIEQRAHDFLRFEEFSREISRNPRVLRIVGGNHFYCIDNFA